MSKDLEEENRGCGTNMADLEKILKECRDDRADPNNKMEESKRRSLLLQSEAMNNSNNVSIRPPINTPSPTSISVGGGGGSLYPPPTS